MLYLFQKIRKEVNKMYTIGELEEMARNGHLPTIGDIEEMPRGDGWGHIPTIGEIEETAKK